MEKSKNKFDTMCVCLQGMGEGPSSPLPTPAACCRLPWPNVRPPPPAQTARHTPLASAAGRRYRRMRRAAAARHLRTRLPTSQPPKGPTNQPTNESINQTSNHSSYRSIKKRKNELSNQTLSFHSRSRGTTL
jgi:hypothetical protein